MEISTLIQIILGIIGGGGLTILSQFFIGKRKRHAEANETEIDSSVKINREWERIYKDVLAEFKNHKDEIELEMADMRYRISSLESELKTKEALIEELNKSLRA